MELYATLRRCEPPDGRVLIAYLGGYGMIRFLVPFFRGDDADRLVFGLAHSQYTALVMIVAAVLRWRRQPRLVG